MDTVSKKGRSEEFDRTKKIIACACLAVTLLGACGANEDAPHENIGTSTDSLFVQTSTIWNVFDVPVCWVNPSARFSRDMVLTQQAIAETWEAASLVRFTGWGNCGTERQGIRIEIAEVRPNSYLGSQARGLNVSMQLNFTFDTFSKDYCRANHDACVHHIAVHEFGHALGFRHEQDRADSDCNEEPQHYAGGVPIGPFDRNSVMNYCNPQWNNNGQLSAGDVAGLQVYYGMTRTADTDVRIFDPRFYLSAYPDLRATFGSDLAAATRHWRITGLPHEGRRGSRYFDVRAYLSYYPDLKVAYGTNYLGAASHWLVQGLPIEGRRGAREFDVRYYLGAYGDLRAAFGTNFAAAASHFINQGLPREGRRGSLEFDVKYYLSAYGDLRAAFGTNYGAAVDHYIIAGSGEGRKGAP